MITPTTLHDNVRLGTVRKTSPTHLHWSEQVQNFPTATAEVGTGRLWGLMGLALENWGSWKWEPMDWRGWVEGRGANGQSAENFGENAFTESNQAPPLALPGPEVEIWLSSCVTEHVMPYALLLRVILAPRPENPGSHGLWKSASVEIPAQSFGRLSLG
jgi:hypothetical protein